MSEPPIGAFPDDMPCPQCGYGRLILPSHGDVLAECPKCGWFTKEFPKKHPCPNCGIEMFTQERGYPDGTWKMEGWVCHKCGHEEQVKPKKCPKCGGEMEPFDLGPRIPYRFREKCVECGHEEQVR